MPKSHIPKVETHYVSEWCVKGNSTPISSLIRSDAPYNRLTKYPRHIYQALTQNTIWSTLENPQGYEEETKERIIEVITSRNLKSYNKEIKVIWEDYADTQNIKTLLTSLDELFIENEFYQDIEAQRDRVTVQEIKEEDLQLVCYEWLKPQ